MTFSQALQDFSKTSCFRFRNGTLSNHYLDSLTKMLSSIVPSQLYLDHVNLCLAPHKGHTEPITGPITSREYARDWSEKYPTYVLHHWLIAPKTFVTHHDFSKYLEFTETTPLVEDLRNFLYASTQWQVIELNDIRVEWQNHPRSLRWNPDYFIPVVQNNRNLIRLACDLSIRYDNSFKNLTRAMADHPCLQELDLQATRLRDTSITMRSC